MVFEGFQELHLFGDRAMDRYLRESDLSIKPDRSCENESAEATTKGDPPTEGIAISPFYSRKDVKRENIPMISERVSIPNEYRQACLDIGWKARGSMAIPSSEIIGSLRHPSYARFGYFA